MSESTLAQRYQSLRNDIAEMGQNKVRLLAVSKRQSADSIKALFQEGQHDFAENVLQEALRKQAALSDLKIKWHYIGQVQSNKCKAIAENFAWLHSLDRLKIAERLNQARALMDQPLNVLIQLKLRPDANKAGLAPEGLSAFVHAVDALKHLQLRGLMMIPPSELTEVELTVLYREMAGHFAQLKAQVSTVDTLSMGMSRDYALAIANGANCVRIGTRLFGDRKE